MRSVMNSKEQFYTDEYRKATAPYASDAKDKETLNLDDAYNKTEYKYNPSHTKNTEGTIEWSVKNLDEIVFKAKIHKKELLDILEMGNLTVVSNHATWANLVILAYVLNKALGVSYENFFIAVGPAITIDLDFLNNAQGVANIIKTLPEKLAKESPGLSEHMSRLFINSLKKDVLSKVGKIVLIAPSGTTDIQENEKILMKNPEGEGIAKLIGLTSRTDHCKVFYAIMNDIEVFQNKSISQGWVGLETIKPMDAPKTTQDIRRNMRPLLLDKEGNKIGAFYNLMPNGEREIISH